jgi:hypothetical protein
MTCNQFRAICVQTSLSEGDRDKRYICLEHLADCPWCDEWLGSTITTLEEDEEILQVIAKDNKEWGQ